MKRKPLFLFTAFRELLLVALTLGALVFSFAYMLVTKKIRRNKSESFVVVTKVVTDGKTLAASAENHGTGDALGVSVTAKIGGRIRKRKVFLLGPAVIRPSEKKSFKGISGEVSFSDIEIVVRYRSRKSSPLTEIWSVSDSGMPIFRGGS